MWLGVYSLRLNQDGNFDMTHTSNEKLIKNLRFLAANQGKIAPYQTVGVIEDLSNAAMVIEKQDKKIKELEKIIDDDVEIMELME